MWRVAPKFTGQLADGRYPRFPRSLDIRREPRLAPSKCPQLFDFAPLALVNGLIHSNSLTKVLNDETNQLPALDNATRGILCFCRL